MRRHFLWSSSSRRSASGNASEDNRLVYIFIGVQHDGKIAELKETGGLTLTRPYSRTPRGCSPERRRRRRLRPRGVTRPYGIRLGRTRRFLGSRPDPRHHPTGRLWVISSARTMKISSLDTFTDFQNTLTSESFRRSDSHAG